MRRGGGAARRLAAAAASRRPRAALARPGAAAAVAATARLEDRQHLTARDDRAVGGHDLLHHAVGRRRDLEHDLVGLEIDEILVAAHGLAGFLVPSDERRIGHRLGKLRNLDLDAHGVPTLSARLRRC